MKQVWLLSFSLVGCAAGDAVTTSAAPPLPDAGPHADAAATDLDAASSHADAANEDSLGPALPTVGVREASAAICGDEVCNGIETCADCPIDCGECPQCD